MEGFSATESNESKLEQAKEQIKKLISLTSSRLGVDIPEGDYPEVKLSPDRLETSAYDPQRNILYLYTSGESGLGSGITYGEEIGHFIRHHICQAYDYKDFSDRSRQVATDEFFGRLSENLAREVSRDTDLSHLFGEEERNFLNNIELEEKIKEQTEKVRPVIEKAIIDIEGQFEDKQKTINKIKDFYSVIEAGESF